MMNAVFPQLIFDLFMHFTFSAIIFLTQLCPRPAGEHKSIPVFFKSGRSQECLSGRAMARRMKCLREFCGDQFCIVLHGTAKYATGIPVVRF
jgi:hypothetical protein